MKRNLFLAGLLCALVTALGCENKTAQTPGDAPAAQKQEAAPAPAAEPIVAPMVPEEPLPAAKADLPADPFANQSIAQPSIAMPDLTPPRIEPPKIEKPAAPAETKP